MLTLTPLTAADFREAHARISGLIHRTPLLTSRLLTERTGFDVRLKAEMFQRDGLVQDPRAAEQVRAAHRRAEAPRRHLLVGRQPRAGRGARRGDATASRRWSAWPRTPRRRRSRRPARTAPRSSCTARSGTRRTRRRSSSSRSAATPTSTRSTIEQLIAGQGTVGLEIYEDWPEVELVDRPDRRRRPDLGRVDGAQGVQPRDQSHRRRVVGRAGR